MTSSSISTTNSSEPNWYGLRSRPAGMGVTPRGHVAIASKDEALGAFPSLRDTNNVRHGAIGFPLPLSENEVKSYELIPLDTHHGIELVHADSIPASAFQMRLIELLANIIFKNLDPYTISEIEYDSEFIMEQAFQQTKVYALRSSLPNQYQTFYKCMKQIKSEALIARLLELIKKDNQDAEH
jgi:hypothetical protein